MLGLGGVRFINSIGVRDWIRLLAAAAKQNTAIVLHRVAVVVVHQLNLVPATRGAQINSFMAPRQCLECKSEMVLRDPAAIYFTFLQA